jgi:hypothetical protein
MSTLPAWQMNASMYLAANGIHEPWIAEISPWQYSDLGKQARSRYDKKRNGEWEASGAGKTAWRAAVIAAYDAGEFTLNDPLLRKEAAICVKYELNARRLAIKEERLRQAAIDNRLDIATVKKGDVVWSVIMGRYSTVLKVNKKTITLETPHGPYNQPPNVCGHKSPREVIAEIEAAA